MNFNFSSAILSKCASILVKNDGKYRCMLMSYGTFGENDTGFINKNISNPDFSPGPFVWWHFLFSSFWHPNPTTTLKCHPHPPVSLPWALAMKSSHPPSSIVIARYEVLPIKALLISIIVIGRDFILPSTLLIDRGV